MIYMYRRIEKCIKCKYLLSTFYVVREILCDCGAFEANVYKLMKLEIRIISMHRAFYLTRYF